MSQEESRFLVLDTETTGLDHEKDRVVEVGAVLTGLEVPEASFSSLVDPGIPIPPAASAIHHITKKDVVDSPSLDEAMVRLKMEMEGRMTRCCAYVAHNAPFDRPFLQKYLTKKPWLDTKRLAQKVLPDLESHKNQFLRYALNLRCPEAQGLLAHRALADAVVTAALLRHLLAMPEVKEMLDALGIEAFCKWIDEPVLVQTVKFGKHKDKKWAELPLDYLDWLLKNATNLDEDTMFTVRYWYDKKRGKIRS